MTKKKITVKLVKSPIACTQAQKNQVIGLGLRRVGSERTLENTPSVRGMIKQIIHMLEIK